MKTMYLARLSAPVLAGVMVLAAACDDSKNPEEVDTQPPTPLKIEGIIYEPKVAVPGDTVLFTAVVTSTSPNVGEIPAMKWTANGGTFVEDDETTVRWVAPLTSGVFAVTAKATGSVNSVTANRDIFIGTGQTIIPDRAGAVKLIGAGPDFHYLRSSDVTTGVDVYQYVGGVVSDAVAPARGTNVNVVYSPDGNLEAHQVEPDTVLVGATARPRHIYLGDFTTGIPQQITQDRSEPVEVAPKRNQFSFPSFSRNSQVVAFQGLLYSWDGVSPDSFHVLIYDRVAVKRTVVSYEHEFPRCFFPSFSTDGKWLTYIADRTYTASWDLYGSPMTGNTVDGSLASLVRMTDTGGTLVTGAPRDLKPPVRTWNPTAPLLAIVSSDGTLYLVETTATGSNVVDVPGVTRAQELVWSPTGSLLAASTGSAIFTVTPTGVSTARVAGLSGDLLRDLAWSPDENWMLYRVTRGSGSWIEVLDVGAGVLSAPVPITPSAPAAELATYRVYSSMSPAWTGDNKIIYPEFDDPTATTPGIALRDLSGLVN